MDFDFVKGVNLNEKIATFLIVKADLKGSTFFSKIFIFLLTITMIYSTL